MNKRDLFINAMKAGNYKLLAWIYSAFCLVKEGPDEYKKNPYPYRIVSTPTGYWFCNTKGELEQVEDSVIGQPLYNIKEKIDITADDIPNLQGMLSASYGNILTNWIIIIEPFGTRVPYHVGKIQISDIEDYIIHDIEDTPKDLNDKDPNKIYIDDYVKFANCVFYLTGLSQVVTWAVTQKAITAPPGIKEYRQTLLDKYKDSLDDAATIAKIDAELVKYDAQWLKGDDSENFLIGKKPRTMVRKKLFLMHGAETGLDNNSVKVKLIQNSLDEGWDVENMPDMINSLRAGSFNRGAQTALGGVSVKWLLRASSNMNVTEDDCGTNIGKTLNVTNETIKDLVGFKVIIDNNQYKVETIDDAGIYLGKTLMVRSPMYCKLPFTDYCKSCVGDRLSLNKDGLSIAVSEYGSKFLYLFMKRMHGQALTLAKMNYKTAIN